MGHDRQVGQHRSPQSSTPFSPARTAGLRPSIHDAATLTQGALSELTQTGIKIATASIEIDNELLRNLKQNQGYQTLQEGVDAALKETDEVKAEQIYDNAVDTVKASLDNLSSFDRKTITVGLQRREIIHRAEKINPHVVGIKRGRIAVEDLRAREFAIKEAGNSGSSAFAHDVSTSESERIAGLVRLGNIDPVGAEINLLRTTNAIYVSTISAMIQAERYEEALYLVRSDEATVMSRIVRDEQERLILQKRSESTWSYIAVEMNQLDTPTHPNRWLTPAGEPALKELRKLEMLNSHHHMLASNKRRERMAKKNQGSGAQSALLALTIAQRELSNLGFDKTLSELNGRSQPNYDEVNDLILGDAYQNHKASAREEGVSPMSMREFAVRLASATGTISPSYVNQLADSISLLSNPTDEQKDNDIRSLEALSVFESVAKVDFDALGIGTAVKNFYRNYKNNRWGIPIGGIGDGTFDYALGSGVRKYNGNEITQILSEDKAYKKTRDYMLEGTGDVGAARRVTRRVNFQMQYLEDPETFINLAVLSYNSATQQSLSHDEIPNSILNALVQTAKEYHANVDGILSTNFMSAGLEFVSKRGYANSTANGYEEPFSRWNLDHPYWGSSMSVQVRTPKEGILDLGTRPHYAATVLRGAAKVIAALDADESKASNKLGESLRVTMERLQKETRFTSGWQFDTTNKLVREGVVSNIIDFDNLPSEAGQYLLEESFMNTNETWINAWAEEAGIDPRQAWSIYNLFAYGEELNGAASELHISGDDITISGRDGNNQKVPASWKVVGQFPSGEKRMITWSGAKPTGWRMNFVLLMGPFEEDAPPQQDTISTNPILSLGLGLGPNEFRRTRSAEAEFQVQEDIEISNETENEMSWLDPIWKGLRTVEKSGAILGLPGGQMAATAIKTSRGAIIKAKRSSKREQRRKQRVRKRKTSEND